MSKGGNRRVSCPYDSWHGTFREYGKHQAKKHRRMLLKNLRKARSAAGRRKSAETRARNAADRSTPEGRIRRAVVTHRHHRTRGGEVVVHGATEAGVEAALIKGHYCPHCGALH